MFNSGENYKDFFVEKSLDIPELSVRLIELIHQPSGAAVLHIQNEDPENFFCLAFETRPCNSKGVAHILEHTVLCGSKKFPIKDPFFGMIRRSLNTFMNALTGPDFTCYPAASQVEKDFYNLLEVYLDAVFHPLLTKESFAQEGCRLTLKDPKNLESPLEWKGIVYNEMKGALQSVDSRLWHILLKYLMPNSTYAYISGGDPKEIPDLSYEELIDFHQIHYHPSHCLFFFYGNLPLSRHLDFIENHVLKQAKKLPPLEKPKPEQRFKSPIKKTDVYPIIEGENLDQCNILSVCWLTASAQDQETVLALTLLDSILMETDASLLRLPLLNSKLCSATYSHLDIEMPEIPYGIICKGCQAGSLDELESLIFSTLNTIASEGIPVHLVEAALHQLEFGRMEITGDHTPFGLTLFMRVAFAKQQGFPPENSLIVHSLFKKLRKKIEDPQYLIQILKSYLIDNPHRLRLDLYPDPKFIAKETEEETQNLEKIRQTLTKEKKESIVKEMEALKIYQDKTEIQNLDCLPKVTLKDIPPFIRNFELHKKSSVFFHPCFTNHITYADLIFDLPEIKVEDLPYLQLLVSILPELGLGKRNYIQNLEYIQSHVGNLSMALNLHVQADNPLHLKPTVSLKSKALERHTEKMFRLLYDLAQHSRLDEKDRIEELILQIYTDLQNKLQKNSLRYATQIALSGLVPSAKIMEEWTGLSYFRWIKNLVQNLSTNLNPLIENLERVKRDLLSFNYPQLVITSDEEVYRYCEEQQFFGFFSLPQNPKTPWKDHIKTADIPPLQARLVASSVAFICEAFKVCSWSHPHSPALTVASYLLDHKVLHPKIREEGGAYGCGSTYSPLMGTLAFYSYRDPHIHSTLETFKHSIEQIVEGNFSDEDLESAKLETIQDLDMPIAPGSRGITAYHWLKDGKTSEKRQSYRHQILNLDKKTVQSHLQKEISSQFTSPTNKIVIFSGEDLLQKESRFFEKPLPIIPI